MSHLSVIGKPVAKIDALGKVTGATLYAGDRTIEGMLYLKVVRSEYPHALIKSINLEAARAFPGVVGAWSAADLPGDGFVGPRLKDEPVLCPDKVNRVGDPLVLIAAEYLGAAEAAAKAVVVDYQPLTVVNTPDEALALNAPLLHSGGNVSFSRRVVKGDVEAALALCEHVIENTYRTQSIEHSYLEPEAGLAHWNGEVLTVELPTKHAHFEQDELARVLDMDPKNIRIICAPMGGYFGDKQCLSPGYYAAITARLTGRPAYMVYSREESFFASNKRHPYTIRMTTGADKEGKLLAVKVDVTGDTGAYASYGPSVMTRTVVHAVGPYKVDNVLVEGRTVYTNNPTCGSMRGFGVPQITLAVETQMDLLAKALNKTPDEIRRLNFLEPGDTLATGQELSSSVGIGDCLDEVSKTIAGLPSHPLESSTEHRTGWGLACMMYGIGLTGLPNPGRARIAVAPGDKVMLSIGIGDGGQGVHTTMVQFLADALGIDLDDINLVAGDTSNTPNSGTSTASRLTYILGRAVLDTAEKLVEALKEGLSRKAGWENPQFSDGVFSAPGKEDTTLLDAVKLALDGPLEVEGSFDPSTKGLDPDTGQGAPYATYAFAVQAAQIALDARTGQVSVLRLIAAHDVGKVIHPVNVLGQVHGGAVMGLGYGLMEELVVDKGRIANPGFRAYLIPSSLDTPEFHVSLVECPEPTGPHGAKGVGEPSLLPTAAAIHNAVGGILGSHPKRIPLTPERVWRVMNS